MVDAPHPETKDEIIMRLQKRITFLEYHLITSDAAVSLVNENARLKSENKKLQNAINRVRR